jgi:predicted RND superfamily exporter protein
MTSAIAFGLPRITFETHAERFLAPSHPARRQYEAFKQDFGLDTAILVVLEVEDVFEPRFLDALRGLHEHLERETPWVEEVKSLANARLLEGDETTLRVRGLLDTLPRTTGESAALESRVLRTHAYRDHLVSSDGRLTALSLRLSAFPGDEPDGLHSIPLSAAQAREAVRSVRAIAERHRPDGSIVHLAGNPVVNEHLAAALQRDMRRFTVIAAGAIATSLVVLFARLSAIALPIGVSLLSILSTLGFAGWTRAPLNVSSQILPPFLLAIGVSASIHLLVVFYRHFDETGDRGEAIVSALRHAGPATLVTSLTTAAGLASFAAASELAPVAQLGLLAPIGVGFTLLFTLMGLPAMLVLLPLRRRPSHSHASASLRLGRSLASAGVWAMRTPALVLTSAAILLGLALWGSSRLQTTNDALAYFPNDDPLRRSTQIFDEQLSGSLNLELLVDTQVAGGLYEPALIHSLDDFAKEAVLLAPVEGAGIQKVLSIVDILRETHEALDGDTLVFRPLPDDRRLIAQELLLFESSGADDLQRLVESDYSRTRITLRGPWVPAQHYLELIPHLEKLLRERLPEGVRFETTGLIVLFARAVEAISRAFVESYATALVLISLLMVGFIGSLRGGLASMVPNILPIAFTLGFMGLVGLDLDLFTLLIGSIALGLAVDDTIHLFHAFRRFYDQTGDLEAAVRQGLETTGSAILTSSIVLCLGFATFAFSAMENLASFGLLTALSIALALVTDVLLLPAMLRWVFAPGTVASSIPADLSPPTRISTPST